MVTLPADIKHQPAIHKHWTGSSQVLTEEVKLVSYFIIGMVVTLSLSLSLGAVENCSPWDLQLSCRSPPICIITANYTRTVVFIYLSPLSLSLDRCYIVNASLIIVYHFGVYTIFSLSCVIYSMILCYCMGMPGIHIGM